ncbi:MAG TPA: hypothetical protein VN739_06285 [Nitrososphaerales archaeon]|nr:hypothetical protein [Nitrososphaerales archaeon]
MMQRPSPKLPHELRSLNKFIGNWSATIRWSEETHKFAGGTCPI